jgi:transcriptional regulator of acetoin/glycerol metabolism
MASLTRRRTSEWIKVDGKTLREIETEAIEKALSRNEWNITHTALELGINRATLYRKMWKLKLG